MQAQSANENKSQVIGICLAPNYFIFCVLLLAISFSFVFLFSVWICAIGWPFVVRCIFQEETKKDECAYDWLLHTALNIHQENAAKPTTYANLHTQKNDIIKLKWSEMCKIKAKCNDAIRMMFVLCKCRTLQRNICLSIHCEIRPRIG